MKLAKQTKREKRDIKSNNFSERLSSKITFNTSSSISKSSKRRISKKQKEQLKPKLTELLTTLPSTTTASTSSASASLPKNTNAPNAAKVSGNKKILQIENANFKNVLKNESFKKSPFESLREMIKNKEELRK